MKILEYQARIKKKKNFGIPYENFKNHESLKIAN